MQNCILNNKFYYTLSGSCAIKAIMYDSIKWTNYKRSNRRTPRRHISKETFRHKYFIEKCEPTSGNYRNVIVKRESAAYLYFWGLHARPILR